MKLPVCQIVNRAHSIMSACLLQDIVQQVEQGSAKLLQAVDWPKSGPDNGKDQVPDAPSRDSGGAGLNASGRQVQQSLCVHSSPGIAVPLTILA